MAGSSTRSASALRRMIVDAPGSLGAKARQRRWTMVMNLFPELADMRVLDLGGTVEWWSRASVKPTQVTVVNLFEPGESAEAWLRPVVGDACAAASLPEVIAAGPFDVVFSNSLIEHVGGYAKRAELARQVRQLADYYWVQTPYRYFPIEPHWLFPGLQFLPLKLRVAFAARWPLAHSKPETAEDALNEVLWTELIGATELLSLFPDAALLKERVAGLTKSITAVHAPTTKADALADGVQPS